MIDVLILGAGVAGAAVAAELAPCVAEGALTVAVLEAGQDVAWGASRTNSAIIHGGFDPVPGTLKARYNVAGARLWPALARALGVRYQQNGSMVLAFTPEEERELGVLLERAAANGVGGTRLLTREEALALEPATNPQVRAALLCEEAGIIDPFGAVAALMEYALAAGVTLHVGHRAVRFERVAAGTGDTDGTGGAGAGGTGGAGEAVPFHEAPAWRVTCENGVTFTARAVVNAAGVEAIGLHNLVSTQPLESRPRRGSYCVLERKSPQPFSHTMFQAPTKLGKGVLISPTVEGNLIVGPDSVPAAGALDTATHGEELSNVVAAARRTWPALALGAVVNQFAGVRPSGAAGDFVLGEAQGAPGFFDIAAFDSPGLTAAPAVAQEIAQDVRSYLGFSTRKSLGQGDVCLEAAVQSGLAALAAAPLCAVPFRFLEASIDERVVAAAKDPAAGHIVCRCEQVSEAEVLAAIRVPYAPPTVESVRRRTRAGTGRCQGAFCKPQVMRLIARETGERLCEVPQKVVEAPVAPLAWYEGEATPGTALMQVHPAPAQVEEPSAPSPLPVHHALQASDTRAQSTFDVCVVGAGAAGLAAATAAARQGATVCLIERDSELGGILTQCIHTGFGLARFGEELTGPEYAAREAATLPNVTLALETFVTGIERTGAPAEKCAEKPAEKCTEKCAEKCAETHASPAAPSANAPQPASQPSALIGRETPQNAQGTCGFTLTCASEARGVYTVAARAVVLACGSRERGRAEISLAGTRAAGIMTAGCAQRLMNVEGVKLGRRAVVVGSGDIGLIMARRLAYTGVEVACVLEREARPGGLRRNIVQCLEDLDIPLYLSTSVLATHGWPHLTHVTVASLDPVTYQPIAGSERDIACDTLLLSVGLVPEVTLAQALGAQLDGATRGPAVDSRLMTSVPGLFVAGNLLHVHDLADYVSHEGAYAGSCAAAYALGAAGCAEGSASGRKHREVAGLAVTRGQGVGSLAPQWLRPQDVGARLYARSNAVIENGRIELLVDGAVVASKRSRCIVPSEMHFLELTPAVAEALDSGSTCELRMVPAGAVAASTTAAPAAARKERA